MTNSARLNNRDMGIIRLVHEYDGCSVEHIRARFFPGPGSRTPCYRRVSVLLSQGYLASTRLPSLTGKGSGKAFFTIGPKARPLLGQVYGIPLSELARSSRAISPFVVSHHLAICNIRMAFELAAERSVVFSLAAWKGDRELHQNPMRIQDPETQSSIVLVPDSSFTLVLPDGSQQSFLLEMDMGTISPTRMREKLRAYLLREEGLTPVLFVAPDQSRRKAIEKWATEEAHHLGTDPTVFMTAIKGQLSGHTILTSPVWQVVGGPEVLSFRELAGDILTGTHESTPLFESRKEGLRL